MAISLEQVTFDCADAATLAGFWAQVVGKPIDDGGDQFFATVGEFDEYGIHWVTLADPEGNVFDLAEIR